MKRKTTLLLLTSLISLSSCTFIDKVKSFFIKEEVKQVSTVIPDNLTDEDNEWTEPDASDFTYVNYQDGIKLTSYSFRKDIPTIAVPKEIKGKKVVAIASDCFKKKKKVSRPLEENPDYDPSAPTFYIGENIIQMDESCFNIGATFFTAYASKPPQWLDQSISYYSAIDDNGNTYYSTTPKEIFIYRGVVYYEHKTEDAYFVAKCLTKDADIAIAPRIKGKEVITLGYQAFAYNSNLESIILPETINALKKSTFIGCTNLKKIDFYDTKLYIIKEDTFTSCSSLEELRLPKNLGQLGNKSFYMCGNIKKVYIPRSLSKIATKAFDETVVEEIYYDGTEGMWLELMNGRTPSGLENTIMHFTGEDEKYVLKTPSKEFDDIPSGSFITVTGIITGHTDEHSRLFITDPETNYTIFCYGNYYNTEFYDAIGRKVTVTGRKYFYYSQPEIKSPTYTFVDEEIYEIKPKEIDWSTNKLEDQIGMYTTISGKVKACTALQVELYEYPGVLIKGRHEQPNSQLREQYVTAEVYIGKYNDGVEMSLYDDTLIIIEEAQQVG